MVLTNTGLIEDIKLAFGSSLYNPEGLAYKDNRLLKCKNKSITSLTIPEGIEVICDNALAECKSLQKISLPSTLKAIGGGAFKNCTSLKSISLPSNLENINSGAFSGCNSLQSVELPVGLKKLGNSVFSGCANLKSIIIPNTDGEFRDIGRAFPINIKEMIIYDQRIMLTWNNFSDFVSESYYNRSKPTGMIIRVPRTRVFIYEKNLNKFAKVENLNYRTPLKIGENSAGSPATVVQLKIRLGSGAHVLDLDGEKILTFAEYGSHIDISVCNMDGKELAHYKDIVVEGTLHGVINWGEIYHTDFKSKEEKQQLQTYDEEWDIYFKHESSIDEEAFLDKELLPRKIIYKIAPELYLVDYVEKHGMKLNNSSDSRIIEVTEIKVTDENPVELTCYMRVPTGVFHTSDLNFVYYSYSDSVIGQIRELFDISSNNKTYFLHFMAYKGMLFTCESLKEYDYTEDQIVTTFEWEGVKTKETFWDDKLKKDYRLKMIRTSGKEDSPREAYDAMRDY